MVPGVVVAHWFVKQRGRALSFMGVGGFLSAVLFPPVNSIMIIELGWRTAWIVLAITITTIMLPVTIFFYRNKPEDMNLAGEPGVDQDDKFK